MFRFWLILTLFFAINCQLSAQTQVKKTMLQCFWWDYENDNYPAAWANYITELAPRLKEMGIDAVWVPPFIKQNSSSSVGYAPFDHYDLGDKFQKGALRTKMGTKDELLRMIAVLHANGIEVIEDIVLNHCQGAGISNGDGGLDPNSYSVASSAGYKNFRYVSWNTPGLQNTVENYWNRNGRWAKNYTNFYPNANNNCTTGDICEAFFGPDISFESSAFGASSNVIGYNPSQTSNYMRQGGRDWMGWLKKQTAIDGYRWDAVKHFPLEVQEDYSWNMKYGLTTWANGGPTMFNVAEWVGSKTALDAYAQNIQNPTGEFMIGTFDFGLRAFDNAGGLYGMVYGLGNFDLSSLPSAQQEKRVHFYAQENTYVHRTAPFVNSHDTFRPNLDSEGNYTSWNNGSELSAHIEPNEARLGTAYAVIMALDGNPSLFFEDLFNIGYNSNRYNHDPKSETELPANADIVNLLWCHQHLDFKSGAYQVPHATPDYLILERAGKALIGITDQFSNAQSANITSSFAQGTILRDYSGAHGDELLTVGPNGTVNLPTVAVNPALNPAGRHGYSVWAPNGQLSDTYSPPRPTQTIQEWEMANDLGDKSSQSLTQGGELPAQRTNQRVAGKIFTAADSLITYNIYPLNNSAGLILGLYDLEGNLLHEQSGTGTISGTYLPVNTHWIAFKLRNDDANNPNQRCFVNVAYTAPKEIFDAQAAKADNTVSIYTGNADTSSWLNANNWEEGTFPNPTSSAIIPAFAQPAPVVNNNLTVSNLTIDSGAVLSIADGFCLTVTGTFINNGTLEGGGCVINNTTEISGSALQRNIFKTVPNPTENGDFQLLADATWQPNTVIHLALLQADGRSLFNASGTLTELNKLIINRLQPKSAGVYFLRVHNNQVLQTLKVVRL